MPVAIRQTILTPGDDGQDVVLLHISDAPLDDVSAAFVVRIVANVRRSKTPTVAHVQRQAMAMAQDALTPLLQQLAKDIRDAETGYS